MVVVGNIQCLDCVLTPPATFIHIVNAFLRRLLIAQVLSLAFGCCGTDYTAGPLTLTSSNSSRRSRVYSSSSDSVGSDDNLRNIKIRYLVSNSSSWGNDKSLQF